MTELNKKFSRKHASLTAKGAVYTAVFSRLWAGGSKLNHYLSDWYRGGGRSFLLLRQYASLALLKELTGSDVLLEDCSCDRFLIRCEGGNSADWSLAVYLPEHRCYVGIPYRHGSEFLVPANEIARDIVHDFGSRKWELQMTHLTVYYPQEEQGRRVMQSL